MMNMSVLFVSSPVFIHVTTKFKYLLNISPDYDSYHSCSCLSSIYNYHFFSIHKSSQIYPYYRFLLDFSVKFKHKNILIRIRQIRPPSQRLDTQQSDFHMAAQSLPQLHVNIFELLSVDVLNPFFTLTLGSFIWKCDWHFQCDYLSGPVLTWPHARNQTLQSLKKRLHTLSPWMCPDCNKACMYARLTLPYPAILC